MCVCLCVCVHVIWKFMWIEIIPLKMFKYCIANKHFDTIVFLFYKSKICNNKNLYHRKHKKYKTELENNLAYTRLPRWPLVAKNLPINTGGIGLGRSPGEHGNPLQYFCLENPHGRNKPRGSDHRVAKSQTQMNRLSTCVC